MGIHPTSIRGAQAVHGLNNQAIFPTIVRSGRTDVVHPGDVAMGDSTGQADFAAETIEGRGAKLTTSRRSTFSATTSPSSMSSARWTVPVPPAPIRPWS